APEWRSSSSALRTHRSGVQQSAALPDEPPFYAAAHILCAQSEYRVARIDRIMRCPVEFGQGTDSWALLQTDMELPILSKDSRLLQILEQHADDLLSARRTPAGLLGLVENQLLVALRSGRVQAAE